MSAVTPTNATVTASGVVRFEYDGVIRAQLGSEIAAAVITGTITETQIADDAISTPKLQAASVITAKLAAAAVTAGKIAAEAVEAGSLQVGAVTAGKIAAEAVESAKIKAGAVTAVTIAAAAVESAKIKAGAVTAEKIAVSELSAISANIGTVTAGVIQGPTIRTGTSGARVQLTAAGLQAFNAGGEEVLSFSTSTGNLFIKGEIKAGSIIPATTITGLLSSAQIAELEATKISGQIAETQIAPEAVSTPKLKAGSVVASKLAAGAVVAEKIAVAELSAITANLGTVTAGTIKGVNIEALNRFTLPEAAATKEEKASMMWLEGATLRSYVTAWSTGIIHQMEAVTETATTRWGKYRALSTVNGNQLAEINAKFDAHSAFVQAFVTETEARIRANTQLAETTILDEAGQSSYLQLGAVAKRKVAFGRVKLTWAASALSGATNVKHGLGVAPTQILFSSWIAPEAGKVPIGNVSGAPGTTEFTCNAETKNVHTGSIELSWMAIA